VTRKRKPPRPPDPLEHQIQASFFEWWEVAYGSPLAFAIPNGGKRHIITAMKMKQEGVKPGVPDVFIAIPAWGASGLFLEFKRRTGRVTEEQASYLYWLLEAGYRTAVVRSLEEAIEAVKLYLGDFRPRRPDLN